MTEKSLPPNVYRVAQRRFDAIPGSPWVYWVSDAITRLFGESYHCLADVSPIDMGLKTSGDARFTRLWWEVADRVRFGTLDRQDALASGARWFPYARGAARSRWSGAIRNCVVWEKDGHEIKAYLFHRYPYLNGNPGWCTHNEDLYFNPVVVWGTISSSGFRASFLRRGNIISNANYGIFASESRALRVLGVLNSELSQHLLNLLSPTINFNKGEVERLPMQDLNSACRLEQSVLCCLRLTDSMEARHELSPGFVAAPRWPAALQDLTIVQARLAEMEGRIDDEVYQLYGIGDADRRAIEAELSGRPVTAAGDGEETTTVSEEKPQVVITQEELAVRWISYAAGIVLGRFQPSISGALGSGVYHSADFAIGSLPEPDGHEFDELVGPVGRFAYVDGEGGRHLFPAEVEKALLELAVPDGITVLDEGHPRDLPSLVERALTLMLGEKSAQEVIAQGTGGNSSAPPRASLRKFLERDFFTKWHLKWYRKRPVYWPFQSARRSYGLVLFHERVERDTLYVLQRAYLDQKLNGLRLHIGDLRRQVETKEGGARKQLERQMDDLAQILDELTQFAATTERIVREGYQPEPNWIDDGVILRLAPLWELMPIWQSEPKKHWQRLERGDFDWSHIAMHYWPDRVREKCKSDKSLAMAHSVRREV